MAVANHDKLAHIRLDIYLQSEPDDAYCGRDRLIEMAVPGCAFLLHIYKDISKLPFPIESLTAMAWVE